MLAIDAGLGVAAMIVGVVVARGWSLGAGIGLVVVGSIYVTMVAGRARRWARLRRDYGIRD